jgi:hypothetical protein
MASHSHDQYQTETKPVAFTVPFILALVTIIVMGLFLTLCDPKPHHEAQGAGATEHDGHRHATEKEMAPKTEPEGPPAHPSAPAEGAQHH